MAGSATKTADLGSFDSQIENGYKLDKKVFNKIRKLVYEQSGINLSEEKEALVRARLTKRMRALAMDNANEYFKMVEEDKSGRELIALLDVISTNVTYFFREDDHFNFLKTVFQEWESEGQRKFRIWSAACSSGEEPYTIAMTLAETINISSTDTKILATDISTNVLGMAQEGIYSDRKLEKVPRQLRSKYFKKAGGSLNGMYQISPNIRNLITFARLNLSAETYPLKGPLDVVIIRNVMIYFDNRIRQRVVDNITRLIKPGGYLIIGHSESLNGLNVPQYKMIKPSVYKKN